MILSLSPCFIGHKISLKLVAFKWLCLLTATTFHCIHKKFAYQPRVFVGHKYIQPENLPAVTINSTMSIESPAHQLVIPIYMPHTVRALMK